MNDKNNIKISNIQERAYRVILSNLDETISELDAVALDIELSNIGLTSTSFIRLVLALEEEFDFEFDDNNMFVTSFSTIRSIVNYVESKIS